MSLAPVAPPGLPQRSFFAPPPVHKGAAPFVTLLCVFLTLGGLISGANYLLLGLSLPDSTLYGTVLALIPLGMLSWYFAWLDSGEAEQRHMFIYAFLWGAVGATGFALILNTVAVAVMGTFVGVAIFAPVAEESLKGLFLLALFWWRRNHLDGPLDGIVYAGFVGMGFAFVENITYFTAAYSGLSLLDDTPTDGGFAELMGTFVMRGLVTPFAHPLFTAAIGVGLGLALTARTPGKKLGLILAGFAGAFGLHALWNGVITAGGASVQTLVYFAFFVPVFLAYVAYGAHQRRVTEVKLKLALRDLSQYGFIPSQDLAWLSSKSTRRTALSYPVDRQAKRAMKAYLYYTIRFAALQIQVREGAAPEDYIVRGQAYAVQLQHLRRFVHFPPSPHQHLVPHPIPTTSG